MFRNFKSILNAVVLVATTLSIVIPLHAEPRSLSIPQNYLANPGGNFQVPLVLNNAKGLAAIQVQINFDSKVLKFQSVVAATLGQLFEMSHGEGDGFVQITFFRADALTSGSGQLAILNFQANPGAVTDLFSELAIANIVLSDSTGVIDLRQNDILTIANGNVAVSTQSNIDNGRNGLPDSWENQHGLNPLLNNKLLDSDNDGLLNLLEYAFGGNPNAPDANLRGVKHSQHEVAGVRYLKLGFRRKLGDTALSFRVQQSTNLMDWTDLVLQDRLIGSPTNMGDGTEYLEIQSTLPVDGPSAQPKGFMRVVVDRP